MGMMSLVGCCAGLVALLPARPGTRLGELVRRGYRRPRHAWWVPMILVAAATATAMPPSVVVSAGIVTATAWIMARSIVERRRRERQRHQLATVLNLVAHHLRSGGEPATALRGAMERHHNLDGELKERLLLLSSGFYGADSAATSMPEVRTVARVWEAAEHHGIALAPLLSRVHSTLEKELRHGAATRARLMGPQSTAVVLTFLPLAGVALGSMMGADPLGLLLGGGLGGMLLMAGITLIAAGALWSHALLERAGGNR
ncbi:type II secretion system F family protein [Corynebacterium oculi]|nr:type II secretion system F family protein [Corynebacterium oculi]